MCGILGFYNIKETKRIERENFISACDLMHHRGPDDSGYWFSEDNIIYLGHKRLSIIDIAGGHQPMRNKTGNLIIVFNGEIYNFKELKNKLLSKGYVFNTNSDTEVILNYYNEFGVTGFNDFNGIFAFGIYDINKKELILARDHFGVKPLYYIKNENIFAFSSEIKSLLELNLIKREIDINALNGFLAYRYNPSPLTLFKNLYKLPSGYYLKIDNHNNIEIKSYIKNNISVNKLISIEEATKLYADSLDNAVKRQLISDVPVGMLLSGGIDSAMICYLMQKNSTQKIKSFTVAFEGMGSFNELNFAKESARIIGTEHYELTITQKEYFDFFTKSFYYLEEPIAITSTTSLYFISKLASEYVKVVLSGQGADEIWAGYKRYKAEKIINDYKYLVKIIPFRLLSSIIRNNESLSRFSEIRIFNNDIERFNSIFSVFSILDRKKMMHDGIFQNNIYCLERLEYLFNQTKELSDSLSKMLYIDTRMNLSNCLLLLADKMSMANSLELRVPYLDKELVKLIETFPSNFKIKGLRIKYLHKIAAKKILPSKIVNRKKIGFETPMGKWLKESIGNYILDLIHSKDSISREFLNLQYIEKLVYNHINHKENNERKLFIILSLEKWYKEFFKEN